MRILLAIGNSTKSALASDELLKLNFPVGSTLRVVTANEELIIVPPLSLNPFAEQTKLIIENLRLQADFLLTVAADKLRVAFAGKNFEIQTETLNGSPEQAIIEEAEFWKADLLVIGSHLYDCWERWLIGSTSMFIAQKAPCTVYIVRQRKL